LRQFCKDNGITLGSISAIGATDNATIGCFKTKTKDYVKKELVGDYEITSLTGNISTMDGQVYLHLHINLSDSDYNTLGGHLNSAVVSGTCEVIINEIRGEVEREYNEEVGLNLYKF
jgi:predicted DNA-binding protein with PD1-like motif